MIVDDSLSIRLMLKSMFADVPEISVVATAQDPLDAQEKMKRVEIDVMTLDVEMPHMDGITFLEKLMKLKPIPVVMISTLTHEGSTSAMKALELGAVDVIGKPSQKADEIAQYKPTIVSKVIAAAHARIGQRKPLIAPTTAKILDVEPSLTTDQVLPRRSIALTGAEPPLIAIGASTGGTEAIRKVLGDLSADGPGVVIVQHMSPGFTKSFAERLNINSPLTVQEAADRMPIERGHAYLAPGDRHLAVKTVAGKYYCHVFDAEKVSRHKPAVNVLFRSVADQVGKQATATLLTGMGDDGATGLKEIADAGGFTIAQDEASCIVFGMPKVAIGLGAAKEILSLEKIATTIKERTTS